jgi:hypothetical protein
VKTKDDGQWLPPPLLLSRRFSSLSNPRHLHLTMDESPSPDYSFAVATPSHQPCRNTRTPHTAGGTGHGGRRGDRTREAGAQ